MLQKDFLCAVLFAGQINGNGVECWNGPTITHFMWMCAVFIFINFLYLFLGINHANMPK